MIEATPVSQKTYERFSAPMFNKLAKRANHLLDKAAPDWAGGRLVEYCFGFEKIGRIV